MLAAIWFMRSRCVGAQSVWVGMFGRDIELGNVRTARPGWKLANCNTKEKTYCIGHPWKVLELRVGRGERKRDEGEEGGRRGEGSV